LQQCIHQAAIAILGPFLSLSLALSLSPPPLGGATADFTAQLYCRLPVADSRDLSLSLSPNVTTLLCAAT